MCLGLANGFINKVNEKPEWDWKKDEERYVGKEKKKIPAVLEDYNVKGNRVSKDRNRGA